MAENSVIFFNLLVQGCGSTMVPNMRMVQMADDVIKTSQPPPFHWLNLQIDLVNIVPLLFFLFLVCHFFLFCFRVCA